jgi:hypothetical protein
VNRAVPPRDRRDRGSNPRRASGSGRIVPGTRRLVGGIEAAASPIRNGQCCATVGLRAFGARVCQSVLGGTPEAARPATAAPDGPGTRESLNATC